ncbi:zn-finger domain-containing protein [Gigaspora margarita]|uniref:Zn-finger domain-containing protein n=1 Tax=Gigaspora margarita TaxID=4874 RepID=A0A8H4B4V5_GIGMA|nr:zn-finger domain-containing protein [Gigaspora margarita]
MSDFKCNFCLLIFAKCSSLSKYMKVYSEFSAKKISFKDIKLHKSSKVVKDIQFNSNSNLDSTLASPLHVSNTDKLASSFDNMSFELDNSNINSNTFEFDSTSNLLDDLETTIDEDQEFSNKILNNSTYFEHIRSSFSDKEIDQKYEEFSNKAYRYADLMDDKEIIYKEQNNGICNMNIYKATVIDRMHHLDLGLFKHQNNFTRSLLKEKYEASILDTIDNRLANIPRFPELKIFKNGIQSLARITANEYHNLMKNLIINWTQQFIKPFKTNSASKLKFSKLHSWIYYTTDLIKKYGCLNGFSTETYESLHKDFVKTPYYLNNYTINIYSSVTLENGSIIQATDDFYRKAWYSNIAVAINPEELLEYLTNEGIIYGQIYLLIKVETAEGNMDNFTLIRWYDFKSTKNQYYYGCPRLKLTELYNIVIMDLLYTLHYYSEVPVIKCYRKGNIVNIEAIQNNVHIIPRFDKTNNYLVNKYIF